MEHSKETDDKIDEVIDNFNFETVRQVMKMLEWTYGFSEECPSTNELVTTARKLLSDAAERCENDSDFFAETGGFRATAYRSKDGSLKLHLGFIVEESETDF